MTLNSTLTVTSLACNMSLMVTLTKENTYQEFGKRLNKACNKMNWPVPIGIEARIKQIQKIFKDEISRNGVRKWLKGEGLPDAHRLVKLAYELNVDFNWLYLGIAKNNTNEPPLAYETNKASIQQQYNQASNDTKQVINILLQQHSAKNPIINHAIEIIKAAQ